MITPDEEKFILRHAYIPEHVVGLMTSVSGGEPFLVENYFCCRKNNWVIFVGYPLQGDFREEEFESVLHKIKKRFRPFHVSLIAPALPHSTATSCLEKEVDHYYTLNIQNAVIKRGLKRIITKAERNLTVSVSNSMEEAHAELSDEFVKRVVPPPRVSELLFRMPEYVGHSNNAIVLNAWDKSRKLAAFYIVDLAAVNFSTYVMGCHSKKNYIPGASDLLFQEMIQLSMEHSKKYIHLGLGVNKGIRRFKEKWGGIPTRRYEMCELVLRKPSLLETFMTLAKQQ